MEGSRRGAASIGCAALCNVICRSLWWSTRWARQVRQMHTSEAGMAGLRRSLTHPILPPAVHHHRSRHKGTSYLQQITCNPQPTTRIFHPATRNLQTTSRKAQVASLNPQSAISISKPATDEPHTANLTCNSQPATPTTRNPQSATSRPQPANR